MTFSISLTEEVYLDVKEAAQWYKEQRDGLQDEFIQSFEQTIERILVNPLGHQLRSHKARYAMLHRFPYKVFYKLYGKQIKVYAVFHDKRNPKLIRKRVK